MMTHKHFIVEIGTEELPPKELLALAETFAQLFDAVLKENPYIPHSEVGYYATPRRLALEIAKLNIKQTLHGGEILGPPVGNPAAQEGFAKSRGIKPQQLHKRQTDDGERWVHEYSEGGEDTINLLPSLVEEALKKIPIKRTMRWGIGTVEFVRPIRWVMMLFGRQSVAGKVLGIPISDKTRGHRFLADKELRIKSAQDYAKDLRNKGYVIAHFAERRADILEQIETCAITLKGSALIADDLLDEVCALVECPQAIRGSFSEDFLRLPYEVIIATLQNHQRYFPLTDDNGTLLPHFITIANIDNDNMDKVIQGNERVIRARLADAHFFFETDRKKNLHEWSAALTGLIFHRQLGNMQDKSKRIATLAQLIAKEVGCDEKNSQRAAELAKADLTTDMVREFPELQGIIGGYYARSSGETEEVAQAIADHYKPRTLTGECPDSDIGCVVSLADRIDTLTGLLGTGYTPSGSSDPYALRRAAGGIIHIIIIRQWDLDLRSIVHHAAQQYNKIFQPAQLESIAQEVINFTCERLPFYYHKNDVTATEIHATVHNTKKEVRLWDMHRRLTALHHFCAQPESHDLIAAHKRIHNILRTVKEEKTTPFSAHLLNHASESALKNALQQSQEEVTPLMSAGSYREVLERLPHLCADINQFFDHVLVMDKDDKVRQNRIALLRTIYTHINQVAAIEYLS